MINKVVLIGRLTKNPELKTTTTENVISRFTIACNRLVKNETQQNVDFINCICWGKTAKNLCEYMDKGSLIAVVGRLQTRNYTNADGYNIYVTEVLVENLQFLQPKKSNDIANANTESERKIETKQKIYVEGDPSTTTIGDFADADSFSNDFPFAEDDLPF